MKIKAFRFQLRTRPRVEAQLRRYAGMGRWVWCRALAEQRAGHARGEKYAGHAEMCKWLTAWRNDPATAWLADGPIHPQQQVLRRLDEAYRRFFAKAGGFPSFKRRGEEPGIRFPDPKQFTLDAANGRIKLPKLGWVRLRMSQPVEGALRNVSITREGSGTHARWFASFQVETSETVTALGVAPTLGIDLGLAVFAATSDGLQVAPLRALAKQQKRLRHAQRAVSRKKKGSANRKKAVARLGNPPKQRSWYERVSFQDPAQQESSAFRPGRMSTEARCMSDVTSIAWCDSTFNGWIGCQHVGPECDNCYAEADFDHRRHRAKWGAGELRERTAPANWQKPLAWNRAHERFFAEHGRRRRVFAHSLSDWADNAVPLQWRLDLLDLVRATPNLTWLMLTKRIGNVLELADLAGGWPANAALGVTAGLQSSADRDIPKLLRAAMLLRPAFTLVSIEPQLSLVDLEHLELSGGSFDALRGGEVGRGGVVERWPALDWVIAGGESGPGARPLSPEWPRSLRDQCRRAGVPFLFKQWGSWAPTDDGRMAKTQPKVAGRLLAGVLHDEFPTEAALPHLKKFPASAVKATP